MACFRKRLQRHIPPRSRFPVVDIPSFRRYYCILLVQVVDSHDASNPLVERAGVPLLTCDVSAGRCLIYHGFESPSRHFFLCAVIALLCPWLLSLAWHIIGTKENVCMCRRFFGPFGCVREVDNKVSVTKCYGITAHHPWIAGGGVGSTPHPSWRPPFYDPRFTLSIRE